MPPDVDRLLANARWVKSLALRIVADEASADDVAQETWLRSLEQPPRDATTARSLRAWLKSVATRFALQRRRRDDATQARERAVARREASDDIAEIVAHAELHRRVVDAVLELDEPQRATVLLRFFEDEAPAQIAARMGVPVKTVYTRLERALARLRARFDAERKPGGELHSWVAGAPLLAGPVLAGRLPTEVVVMSGRAWLAIGVLVAAGAAVLRWESSHGDRGGGPGSDATSTATGSADSKGVLPAAAADARRVVEAPSVAPPRTLDEINTIVFSGAITVTGRVVDERDRPLEGARVECSLPDASTRIDGVEHVVDDELRAHGFWDAPCAPPRTSAASDDDGRFEIRGLRTGMPYTLTVVKDGYRTETRSVPPDRYGDVTLGACTEVRVHDVVLAHGGGIAVHVVDARGADVGGAAVYSGKWADRTPYLWPVFRSGTSDGSGRLSLAPDRSGRIWIAARARDGREAVFVDATVDESAPPIELRLPDGESLRVRVRDHDGHALAGLRVTVRSAVGTSGATIDRDGTTDDTGRVEFLGLQPVTRTLYVGAPGGLPNLVDQATEPVAIAADAHDVELTYASCRPPLAVRFVDAVDGAPVCATALLVVDGEVDGPPSGDGRGGRDVPTRGIASLSVDGTRGSIVLCPPRNHPIGDDRSPNGMQSERFRVIVDARGHARTRLGPFDPGQLSASEPLALPIERGRLVVGSVRDESGAPIPGARVHEIGPGPGRASNMFTWQVCTAIRAALCDRDGAFTLGLVAAGEHEFVVDATGFVSKIVKTTVDEKETARLQVMLGRGATVGGAVRLEADEEPGSFEVVLQRRGAAVPDAGTLTASPDDAGHFAFPALPPGDYAILALRPPSGGRDWFAAAMRLMGAGPGALAPQVVFFTLSDANRSFDLDPWREAAGRRRLETQVVDRARPGAKRAALLYLDASGLPHHDDVDLVDGRLAVDLPDAKQYLVLLSEDGRALDLAGAATTRPWYVASRVLSSDDVKRGVPSLRVPRGTVKVRVVRPDGSALGDGLRLIVCFFVDHGFSASFPELLMGNTQVVALPPDGRMTLDDLPVGRTWLYVSDASHQGHGEVYVNIVEGTMIEAEIAWK